MHTCTHAVLKPLLPLPHISLRGCCAGLRACAVLQATGGGDVHLEDEEQDEGDIYSMYRLVGTAELCRPGIAACSDVLSSLESNLWMQPHSMVMIAACGSC
jgi:hypothetical protein